MKPEQQNIAIAEACGAQWIDLPDFRGNHHLPTKLLTFIGVDDVEKLAGTFPVLVPTGYKNPMPHFDIPKYTTDLNAMHESEKTLDDDQWANYFYHLNGSVDPSSVTHDHSMEENQINISASRRAEAFLKTINKWGESE